MNESLQVLQRHPRRISLTLNQAVHEALLIRSKKEGRSVSNLCAFLLEHALAAERQGEVGAADPLAASIRRDSPTR
jgi:hypothetical protein